MIRNCDGSPVERLMVNAAAGEAVIRGVGSSKLAPPDVRRLQRQIRVIKLYGVAAENAAMTPGCHD